MSNRFNPIQHVEDDGLPVMDVGNWAQKKYTLVGKYCDIFTSGMKNKWNLVYIDLFSGPGYVRNRHSGQLMKNAGMLVLNLPKPFDHYVYNDYKAENAEALKTRILREHPNVSFRVFNEDANSCVEDVLATIPRFNNGKGTLIFSFLDPFSLNLNFETVKTLGQHQVDILVLHALQMDARRNHRIYTEDENNVIASFTGNTEWRNSFKNYVQNPTGFMQFVSEEFDRSILKIGYQSGVKERIENTVKTGLYYLCFYSKHERGIEFFNKIRRTGNQYELF